MAKESSAVEDSDLAKKIVGHIQTKHPRIKEALSNIARTEGVCMATSLRTKFNYGLWICPVLATKCIEVLYGPLK
jgi:hypothetical protein